LIYNEIGDTVREITIGFINVPFDLFEMESYNEFVEALKKECCFKYDESTTIDDLYLYLFDVLHMEGVFDKDACLDERFKFVIDGMGEYARLDYNLSKFLNFFFPDSESVKMLLVAPLEGGNGAEIIDLAQIRINPREEEHKYMPHVDIIKPKKTSPRFRISLEDFNQIKDDEPMWEKHFSKKERAEIVNVLKENQNKLREWYRKMQNGIRIDQNSYLTYKGKEYLFKT